LHKKLKESRIAGNNILSQWKINYMPTEPNKDLLIRQLEDPKLAELLALFASKIEEAVNFGTHIIPWCYEQKFIIPPIGMLRHTIDLCDAISILVKNSSIDPCFVILRSQLEICWELKYMLEKDTPKRAMAFLVWYTHNEINKAKKVDTSFPESKEFQKVLEKEIISADPILLSDPNIVRSVDELQDILNRPICLDAVNEYKKYTKENRRKPKNWYSLYLGPKNVYELAKHLKQSAFYERKYRIWSESTHGTDIIAGKLVPDGIKKIRSPIDTKEVTRNALNLATDTYLSFIKGFIPDKEPLFHEWFEKEIKKFLSDLSTLPSIIKVNE
jgi:hypothetical protein